ncbi:MAG: chromosome segregation protein SMC [Planctomycetes bacterium]|nr:chromosome segregation protein SMC [Planctomycetota bacterium]
MRLQKIILNGFKSFADKTEFSFDCPVTTIVGPNGCGKSNVVDAIKWVLGEQSVKSLRSGQMADVIFSGSISRKPSPSAEVSLLLSGTSGKLAVEGDQLKITRKIFKSGDSEYRLNNKICRLKDIRELLMDTGIGVKAYSIIEQGQVERLLTASKTDRRAIFEEAAGISKYKAHKKEALRKLDRTEQNLLRLADVLAEVQKQLRSIKLQAGKARNYLAYTEKLKELQVNYSLVEYHKINILTKKKNQTLEKMQQNFAAVAAQVAQNDSLISSLGAEIIETETKLNQSDNAFVSVQSKIEQKLQRIEFLKDRISELTERKDGSSERIETLQQQKQNFTEDLDYYNDELQNSNTALQEKTNQVEKLQKDIEVINAECASLEADLEDEKSGIIDAVRRTAQLHNELQSINVYRDNLSSQKDRLTGRADTVQQQLQQLLAQKSQNQVRLIDVDKVLDDLGQSLDAKRKRAEEIEQQIEQDKNQLLNNKEARSALSSEMTILTDMETRHEGINNAVKNILRQKSSQNGKYEYVQAMVAEAITADVEYAGVIEAALEGKTDSLIVNNSSALFADKETLDKLDGRVNFICTDKITPFVDSTDLSKFPSVKGRVAELVKYDSQYATLVWNLLGKTLLVDSIESAIELMPQLSSEYRFVTQNGELLTSDGSVKLGPVAKTTGLISRKSRLNQLNEALSNITKQLSATQNQITQNQQTSQHLAKLRKELRTAIYEANTEKTQINAKLNPLQENIDRIKREQPLITGEIDQLAEQIDQSVQKEYNSKQKLEELETVNAERTARIEELETLLADRKMQQQALAGCLTDIKVSLGQISEQNKAMKQTIASIENQVKENSSLMQAAKNDSQNCGSQALQAQRDILTCESEISELFVEKEEKQNQSRLLREKVNELIEKQKQLEQLIREKRSEEHEIDQQINELRIELSQLEVKEQGLVERVREELNLDLNQSYENYEDQEVDWQVVKEEIADLKGKIERLGNVNLDAIEQQEELEKRNEFLSSQVEDLNNSKNQLQQLINRLNKQSREKFRETFELIREHFQQIFRKLFGGGKADILLEDAEDILESGIEIMAKPPGKETRSISLLSGGEKTMTAIALLFSVFKAKPSPFCLLDEVDAALDETNNERFNRIIQEFQKDSQFIIITHSKRTMSIADELFGVTMQTRGVSKKISVKFEDYDADEDNAAVA